MRSMGRRPIRQDMGGLPPVGPQPVLGNQQPMAGPPQTDGPPPMGPPPSPWFQPPGHLQGQALRENQEKRQEQELANAPPWLREQMAQQYWMKWMMEMFQGDQQGGGPMRQR